MNIKKLTSSKILRILIISILLFTVIQLQSSAYFLDVEPKPEYADEHFIVPLEVENMANTEYYQLFVILAMLLVNSLKIIGMYFALKQVDPTVKFDPTYVITAILGVFLAYGMFEMTFEGTYIDIFMKAGYEAFTANLLFDFGAKAKEKLSKPKEKAS